jgi:hypothetical protein
MEFPISRKSLQNFSQDYYNAKRKECVEKVVNQMRQKIVEKAYADSQTKVAHLSSRDPRITPMKLVLQISLYSQPLNEMHSFCPMTRAEDFLEDILQGLRKSFPDTTFQVDPMKTYILADWSPIPEPAQTLLQESQAALEKSAVTRAVWERTSKEMETRLSGILHEAEAKPPSLETASLVKMLQDALARLQSQEQEPKPQVSVDDDDELYS